jgi:hypothetical protein
LSDSSFASLSASFLAAFSALPCSFAALENQLHIENVRKKNPN